jgi:hypothetical protein
LCSLNAVKHVGSLNEFMRVKLASKWDLPGTFCIEEKQTDASGSADMAKSVGNMLPRGYRALPPIKPDSVRSTADHIVFFP